MPYMLTHLVCAGGEVTMTTYPWSTFPLGCSIAFRLSRLVGEKPTMEGASTHAGQPSVFRLKKPLPLDVVLPFGRCNTRLNLANAQCKGKTGSCGKAGVETPT